MRINAISCNYNANMCKNTTFNGLIKEQSALPIIKSMSDKDKIELKKIEKRLSKTNFRIQYSFPFLLYFLCFKKHT